MKKQIVESKSSNNITEPFAFNVLIAIRNIINFTQRKKLDTPSIFDVSLTRTSSKDSTLNDSDTEGDDHENMSKKKHFEYSIDDLEVEEVVKKCIEYLEFNKLTLCIFMIYLDRILEKNFILSKKNVNRLVFTGLVLAHKYSEDNVYRNKDYAKIGGISHDELLSLELEFSHKLEFNFFIQEDYYNSYLEKIKNYRDKK